MKNTHLFVEVTIEQSNEGALEPVHRVEGVVVRLLLGAVLRAGTDQSHKELDTEQRH